MQVGCDQFTLSPGHNVTGQGNNLGREWEAYVFIYSRDSTPPGFTMHGLPPRLLVSSAYAVLELAHTPVYHRAIYSQCHPGDSERPRKTPCRGRGELMSAAVRIFNVHSMKKIKQQTCLLSLYKGVNENFTESKTKQYANDGKNQLIPFRPDWAEASGELLERW